MRPLDPRLLREVAPARRWVVLTASVGTAVGALVVAQAWLLADVIAAVFAGADVTTERTQLVALGGVVVARAALAWVQQRYGERAATGVISELRHRVLAHAVALGPVLLRSEQRSGILTLAGLGLENLRPYLSRYLPQLLMTAVLTPALLVVVAVNDVLSAMIIAVTLPLVPLFMALVGWMTQRTAARRLTSMQRLGAQVIDLVAGLPTLVAFGREQGPAARVRALGDAHRRAANATLRVAFLSSMVLELLTTLSVALVAVTVGLRLLAGSLDLRTALVVLVLAPEVYLPLRQVGTQFHASTDGLAATDQAFTLLHRPVMPSGAVPAPDLRTSSIELTDVLVRHEGRSSAAPDGVSLTLLPGRVTALIGPSGGGKSTLAEVVLRLRPLDGGQVEVIDAAGRRSALADVEAGSWHEQCAWLGQHPLVVAGTVRENAVLYAGAVTPAELDVAARASGLADVLDALPQGWDTRVGDAGVGLSAGQGQRLALTRVLLTAATLVVMDEPSAHLDESTQTVVLDAIRALRDVGRTVLVIAHRPVLAQVADTVVTVAGPVVPVSGAQLVGAP